MPQNTTKQKWRPYRDRKFKLQDFLDAKMEEERDTNLYMEAHLVSE